jgi:glycosyltransferase involved in cell wall biosynthesis
MSIVSRDRTGDSRRKRILLITYSYPPDPIVGAFRPQKIVNTLLEAGHQVDVITARLPEERAPIRMQGPGLCVHTIRYVPNPRHLYLWMKGLRGGGAPAAAKPSPTSGSSATVAGAKSIPSWKRLLLSLLRLPDDVQGFIPAAVLAALPLVRQGVDLVYTTAPPFSVHITGLLLRRLTGTPWIAEFRDPWSDNSRRPAYTRSRVADAANRWLEKECLAAADHVVAVSEFTRRCLGEKMGDRARDDLSLILNGIDEIAPAPPPTAPAGPFRIVHAGSLNRDIGPFLEALASVRKRLGLGAADLQVELIGRYGVPGTPRIPELTRRYALDDVVSVSDWIPQPEARAKIASAHLLVLFFDGYPEAIPYKLFDYLGIRRLILAVVDQDGEAASMLRRAGGHLIVNTNSREAIESALEAAVVAAAERPGASGDEAVLREWSTRNQMAKLLTVLGAGAPSPHPAQAVRVHT